MHHKIPEYLHNCASEYKRHMHSFEKNGIIREKVKYPCIDTYVPKNMSYRNIFVLVTECHFLRLVLCRWEMSSQRLF